MYENKTLKPIEVILRTENNGGDETNQTGVYVYMEMSQ
jgi:hypothetical protein